MKKSCQCWVPDSALLDGVLETRFLNLSLDWARHWFAADTCLQVDVALNHFEDHCGDKVVTCLGAEEGDAIIGLATGGDEVIARTMLAIPMKKGKPNVADRQLFQRMAEVGVQDFGERLAVIVPKGGSLTQSTPTDLEKGKRFVVSVSVAGRVVLDVSFACGLAAALRKSLVEVPPVVRGCGSFLDAIRFQTVRVGARLGASLLTVSEFDALAAGDIILLDQSVNDPVELTIEDVPAGSRCATLEASDLGVSLRFREMPYV